MSAASASSALVSAALLPGLAAGGAVLMVLALLAALVPRMKLRAAGLALAGAGTVAALAHLVLGAVPARLALPFAVAGVRPVLALDGLASFFLVVLLPVGMAGLARGAGPGLLALLGSLVLAVLAAEAGMLALGVAASCLAIGGMRPAWLAGVAVPALVIGLALPAGDPGFAAVRAQVAAGGAGMAPALVLVAGGALAALAPLHRWPHALRTQGGGLAGTLLATLGLYLLARGMLDLAGPLAPGWALPLLMAGGSAAMLGGLAAARARDMRGAMAGVAVARSGLVALGLGMAVAARGVDDGPAAALALGAALFLMAVLGWAQALAALAAGAVEHGAGSQALARLGGLVHRMRFTFAAAAAACLAVAMLPPGAGFAGLWLLVRAATTLPRGGGAEWWALGLAVVAAAGLAAALLGFAVLRGLGVAFLGRPRSPRAAAAEEVGPAWRWAMLAFSAVLALSGLVPGIVLALAGPAVAMLAGAAAPGGWLSVQGYAPLGLALLVALAGAVVALGVRARAPAGHRVAPAWEGGQSPSPSWLPFGDPATQLGAAGFARTLGHRLPRLRLPSWPLKRLAAWPGRGFAARVAPLLLGLKLVVMLALHGAGLW